LLEHKDYKTEFILEPLIKKGGINYLAAERGTGKTRLSVSIAHAVAYGLEKFLGYSIKNNGSVLYINLELTSHDFKTFIDPIKNHFNGLGHVQKFDMDVISFKNDSGLKFEDIIRSSIAKKYVLIIIDGFKMLNDFYLESIKSKELTNSNVRKLYDSFNEVILNGGSLLITNHTNKGTSGQPTHSDMIFGPGAVVDYSDGANMIRKAKEPNQKLLIPCKERYTAEGTYGANLISIQSDENENKLWFELIEEDVNENDYLFGDRKRYSKEVKEKAIQLHNKGMSTREIAKTILGNEKLQGTISKWIKKGTNS